MKRIAIFIFSVSLLSSGLAARNAHGHRVGVEYCGSFAVLVSTKAIRTELYFGRNRKNTTPVSNEEFESFLDEVVTPRFPIGLTVIDAKGQWRGSDGYAEKELTKVLIIVYPAAQRRAASRKLEEIRTIYKERFRQESVLRIDTKARIF